VARSDIGLRSRQSTRSPQVNSGETFVPVPSILPSATSSPGHDRVLSHANTHSVPENRRYQAVSESTPGSFLCLMPNCMYSAADVWTLESHYNSIHAGELSSCSPTVLSTSHVSCNTAAPVTSLITQRRGRLDTVQTPARVRPDLASGVVHIDSTETFTQQLSTVQVQGTGILDPDIDCRIVGSCDHQTHDTGHPQDQARLRRTDVAGQILQGVSGLFAASTLCIVALLWNFLEKIFSLFLSNRPSDLHKWKCAFTP
jgi:hypothetical protein